jgi:hypothetical protein
LTPRLFGPGSTFTRSASTPSASIPPGSIPPGSIPLFSPTTTRG